MSEQGFFHTSIGYWQTTGEPPEDILAAYPEGTYRVPLKPGENFEWIGGKWEEVQNSQEPVLHDNLPFPTITSRQLWLAAYRTMALKEDDVIAMTATMEDQEAAEELRIEIRKAQTYERDHPAMDDLVALVGLPVEQFNALWRWAATL